MGLLVPSANLWDSTAPAPIGDASYASIKGLSKWINKLGDWSAFFTSVSAASCSDPHCHLVPCGNWLYSGDSVVAKLVVYSVSVNSACTGNVRTLCSGLLSHG